LDGDEGWYGAEHAAAASESRYACETPGVALFAWHYRGRHRLYLTVYEPTPTGTVRYDC
jgi:hypothetical protein